MRLKQIKLAGFKSFVDPTTVTLPGNRCAVVGPNGCGKSNIIDAVRWVMGESSAKQLRGESLTDVIFNGSNSRKPTAVASIELFFDNSDGRIGGEYAAYAEIAIRRQVSRDGQSNYYLNGNKCRRRDIQDIFLGTGFGPRSYSIIEQGMISQLVEAKPEELRVYLEEAAGISKYKERRRETENRIRHTRENLERINDIREELSRQLDRLQRQSKAAEKYRELRAEESLLTAQLYVLRHGALRSALSQHDVAINELKLALEKALAGQRALEAEIEQSRAVHAEHTEAFGGIQGSYYELGAEIARIEEAIQFNQSRVSQLRDDLETVRQRAIESTRQLGMDETQINDLENQIGAIAPKVEALSEEDKRAQHNLEAVENRIQAWQSRWDSFNSIASSNDREAEVLGSRIEHVEQLLQRLRRRGDELSSQEPPDANADAQEVDVLAQEIASLERRSRTLEASIDECLKELAQAREDVLLREQALEEARAEVQNLRHELATLQAVQEAALGQHVREAEDWIAQHNLSASDRLGEMLSVVPGWEFAVEAVLGRLLSALRVEDLDDFAESLAQLPDGELALFTSLDGGAGMAPQPNSEVGLPTLASLVRSESLSAGSLLHGVYAAQSTAVAMANRKSLASGESIITREGFWVGVDWVRVIHDRSEQQGVIERGQMIETLEVRVEDAERSLTDLQRHVQDGRARVEGLEQRREELQKEVNGLQEQLSQRRTDHGVTQVKIEEAHARSEQINKERAEIEEQIVGETERLRAARSSLVDVETRREAQVAQREQLSEEKIQMDAALSTARSRARQTRDEYHALNVQREALHSRLGASETARDRLVIQKRALEEQRENLQAGIENSEQPLPQLKEQLESKLARRMEVEGQLADIRTAMNDAETKTRQLEGGKHDREQEVQQVREQLEAQRVERQGLVVQESTVLEQLEATGHDLAEVRRDLPEGAEENQWQEDLSRLDRRIQRLGPINLAAIEEYEQESERKVYLDAQSDDLEQALATLTEAIQKIDKETRSRFKDTFEAVNSRLGELFPKVFGGGHAYLELTGEDLLDTGVSLMARPPGKRNASVHLLSGGEKALTAVALIFAIFHLNPSPVCLLDEVDAPLDDANVSRFASLIEEMSSDVQFLVITHNKITMEMADYLMGVTMQEAGVSRLVSVDVDEAAAMAVS